MDAEIKRSIDSQLKTKNLTLTDNKPDLIVDYHVAISQEEKWPPFRYNEISEGAQPVMVHAGTLGIDLRDPALNQIVWSGRVSKAVDPSNAAAKKQRNLAKAISELLKGFPPR